MSEGGGRRGIVVITWAAAPAANPLAGPFVLATSVRGRSAVWLAEYNDANEKIQEKAWKTMGEGKIMWIYG